MLIEFYRSQFFSAEYLRTVFYIHSSDSLSYNDWLEIPGLYHSGLFNEYFFKKLEPPYDTNCKKYVNKTSADCLNDCLIKFQNSS
jgi:hypothetical protein